MLKIGYENYKIKDEYFTTNKTKKDKKQKNDTVDVDKTSIDYLKRCILAGKIL